MVRCVNSAGTKDDSLCGSEACVGKRLQYCLGGIVSGATTHCGFEFSEVLHLAERFLNAEVGNAAEGHGGQWRDEKCEA